MSTANSFGLFEVVVRHVLAVLRSRCAGFACPASLSRCPGRWPGVSTIPPVSGPPPLVREDRVSHASVRIVGSGSQHQNTMLMSCLAWFCTLQHDGVRYSAVNGPKSDPSFSCYVGSTQDPECFSGCKSKRRAGNLSVFGGSLYEPLVYGSPRSAFSFCFLTDGGWSTMPSGWLEGFGFSTCSISGFSKKG